MNDLVLKSGEEPARVRKKKVQTKSFVVASPGEAAFLAFTYGINPKERGELATIWLSHNPPVMKLYVDYGKEWAREQARKHGPNSPNSI